MRGYAVLGPDHFGREYDEEMNDADMCDLEIFDVEMNDVGKVPSGDE